MKFYFIGVKGTDNDTTGSLLQQSCLERNIEFVHIDPNTINLFQLPTPEKGDLYYKAAVSTKSPFGKEVEIQLLRTGLLASFYTSNHRMLYKVSNSFVLYELAGIPIPPTIPLISSDTSFLATSVEKLDGFPLIVKVLGGSHGIGVIKIDSMGSLKSLADFLITQGKDIVLRKFINVTNSARLIVLGDAVIDSIEYQAPIGDFHSNEGSSPNVRAKEFSDEIKHTAVAAVKALDIEFGGVDILIDDNNHHYVAEVNFPCYFPRCQMLTGIDISGMMIDYLLQKNNF